MGKRKAISKRNSGFVPRFLRIHKARIGKHWIWPEHTNRDTEIVLIKKGAIRCQVDKVEFTAHDGDVFFVQTGQLHYEEILTEHLDIFTLRFDLLDKKHDLCRFIACESTKPQSLKGFEKVSIGMFEQILQLVWNEEPGAEKKVGSIILKLIEMIKKQYGKNKETAKPTVISTHHSKLILQSVEYIRANLDGKICVPELAKVCYISPHYFAHIFKETMGVSPLRYVQQLRIDQAKRLLADDLLYVYQVAQKVGYSDPFYFSRIFKKATGYSPQTFRSHIHLAQL